MVIVAVGSLLSRRAAAHPNCASLKSVLPGRDNTLFGRTEVERRLQGSVQASGVYPRTAQDANRLTPMKVFRRDTHAAGTESGFGSAPPCVQLDDNLLRSYWRDGDVVHNRETEITLRDDRASAAITTLPGTGLLLLLTRHQVVDQSTDAAGRRTDPGAFLPARNRADGGPGACRPANDERFLLP